MDYVIINGNSTVEVPDVEVSDDGTISIIPCYEDDQQLSDLIRYQSDDLEDEMFDTPTDFMKVTDEQIDLLFS